MTTNTNVTGKINLFERTTSVADIMSFQHEAENSRIFTTEKCDIVTKNTDINETDLLIARSRIDGFCTVWARHPRKKELSDFGIRISKSLVDNIPAIGVMFSNAKEMKYGKKVELRISTTSLNNVRTLLQMIYMYNYTYTHKTKAIESVESVIA